MKKAAKITVKGFQFSVEEIELEGDVVEAISEIFERLTGASALRDRVSSIEKRVEVLERAE